MNHHHLLLVFHLLAATIWIGGHLLLSVGYLPKALKEKNRFIILNFEAQYERLGMSALLVLVASGVAMAFDYGVYPNRWFHFSEPIESMVSIKLLLLFATFSLAVSAQRFAIPKLKAGGPLNAMAFHIISVTTIGILMLIVGSSIRFGGL